MPLILRSTKGSKLSISEMDGNFTYLQSLALSGATSGTTIPGGADTQVQFNDNGQFGGNANMTFDKNTSVFGVSQVTAQNGVTAAFFSNPQTITTNQTINDNHNAIMVGPTITVEDGIEVIVGNNSFLTIINGF